MNSVQKKLNLKFFCTEFVILLPLPPKHQKDLFVDIMRKNRTPMVNGMFFQRCLSEGVDIFSKSAEIRVERTGRSRQADVAMDGNWSRARTD